MSYLFEYGINKILLNEDIYINKLSDVYKYYNFLIKDYGNT